MGNRALSVATLLLCALGTAQAAPQEPRVAARKAVMSRKAMAARTAPAAWDWEWNANMVAAAWDADAATGSRRAKASGRTTAAAKTTATTASGRATAAAQTTAPQTTAASRTVSQTSTATSDASDAPATFEANADIGSGGSSYVDSAHFRVYADDTSAANEALEMFEAAYECFVGTLNWRSTGLSYNDKEGTGSYTKINAYSVATLANAAGVMHADATTGMGWLEVQNDYLTMPGVTIHEFGHVMHYHQMTWVDMGRTGAWWETLGNWVADTFQTSDLCAAARTAHGQTTATTSEIEVNKVIGDSFQVIVDGSTDTGNYYQAWPFFTYLTNNPDGFANLGTDTLHQMMVQYEADSNETPLHTLARVAGDNTTVAEIVGRYWARMAYLDINHSQAQQVFLAQRGSINYANVDAGSDGSYTVKSARAPQYMGANIMPLTASAGAEVSVAVTADAAFTATLAAYDSAAGTVRYVDLADGKGSVTLESGEEVSLVVANTPADLILYDGFSLTDDVTTGLNYSFTLTGATVSS